MANIAKKAGDTSTIDSNRRSGENNRGNGVPLTESKV